MGWEAGCPACGRLKAVCAGWRACSVREEQLRTAAAGGPVAQAGMAAAKARPAVLRHSEAVLAVSSGFDPSVPNMARVYDYWLGGKDHFPADRQRLTLEPEPWKMN